MTAPLCAMWLGHCPNPAKLIVDVQVQVHPGNWAPLFWLVCGDLSCLRATEDHVKRHGLAYVGSRRLTPADIAALTAEAVAA